METLRRFCLECGKRIVGRADKKFCDDACRNDFNNKQNGEANKTSKQQLQKAGFDFKYMTHVFTSNSGDTYYFCYEQAYVPLENNYFALVVDQDYAS
jgi:predicted nucleic acid-binding Zn ribbon protein